MGGGGGERRLGVEEEACLSPSPRPSWDIIDMPPNRIIWYNVAPENPMDRIIRYKTDPDNPVYQNSEFQRFWPAILLSLEQVTCV